MRLRFAFLAALVTSCAAMLGIEEPEHARDGAAGAPGDAADVVSEPDGSQVDATEPEVGVDAPACEFAPIVSCGSTDTQNCASFTCECAEGTCSGGACDGDGCSTEERSRCTGCDCRCVDHQCSGGHCPGTGCTAKQTSDCANVGCDCVDHTCSGGFACTSFGNGCTDKESEDCAKTGCACANHQCTNCG